MKPSDVLVAHVISTLPDSLSERRRLLESACDLIGRKHPLFEEIKSMVLFLNAHEAKQLQLPIAFQSLKK